MLKIIGILALIALSTNAFSHEYEVVISDDLTGEVVVEKCANEVEVKNAFEYVQSLKDESVKFSVKRLFSIGVMAVKKGGGEGGTD
jgi:hypothetical protein